MMQFYEEVIESVATGKPVATPINPSTLAKLKTLARMKLGLVALRVPIETFKVEYEAGVLVETLAEKYSVTIPYLKDVVRAFGLSRDQGAIYRAGQKEVWNHGLTKETDDRVAKMAADRIGEGNPMFGADAWNKGLTKDGDPRLARVSQALAGRDVSVETRRRLALAKMGRSGPASNRWTGGRQIGGYSVGAGRKYEHRQVAEEVLGRELERWEHVHHIDRNRTNNDPCNLIVIHQADHARLHGAINKNPDLDQLEWLRERGVEYMELSFA